jgi:serine phosphatase RsbU (regulator of sigma subunit)
LLVRGTVVSELSGPALPILTFLRGRTIEPFTVDLDGEWGLLLFTDGLIEGREAPGSKARLGVDALVRELQPRVAAGMSRAEIAPELLAEAERCNGGPLTDDVAVLLVGSAGWWR